jgi:triosephosphate isomerase
MIIINFKNYKTGKKALKLAKLIQKINKNIIVAVPATDIEEIAKNTKLKVYAQHVSYKKPGKSTGYIIPEEIKIAGAKGSIINHSEHRIPLNEIKQTVQRLKKLKLKTLVCIRSLKELAEIKKLKPDFIAYEDPKLISTKKSITKYRKDSLKKFVDMLKRTNINPICGAGIHTKEDILEAYKLGCKGVLIASAIANSKNPEKFLKEIKKF